MLLAHHFENAGLNGSANGKDWPGILLLDLIFYPDSNPSNRSFRRHNSA